MAKGKATTGLPLGDLFADRYRVLTHLGDGGMGSVFKVRDEQLDEIVALKVLTFEGITAEDVERFRREVKLARRITHRNVARTHDFGTLDGAHFLTMEYIEGRSLDTHIGTPMDVDQALDFTRQIALGLHAAHLADVVHRDLKPSNIMVEELLPQLSSHTRSATASTRCVLTDFGLAFNVQDERLTLHRGVAMGTPMYMAPEQVIGEEVSPQWDVYALGLVLFEMLTGTTPFSGTTPMAVAAARLRTEPDDLGAHDGIPEWVAKIVRTCLKADTSRRFSSALDVAKAIEGFRHSIAPTMELAVPSAGSVTLPRLSIALGRDGIAVLPFRYRGPEDTDFLGDSMAEELVDLLGKTRGLRVIAFGAMTRYRNRRDPQLIGSELNVDYVADGTVQRAGEKLRIHARLLAVEGEEQIWSERFDVNFEDVFEVQERMGLRIAEALRVELSAGHRSAVPADIVEAYLRARRQMRHFIYGGNIEGVELLEHCIESAPTFKPAIAAHAIACVRVWWSDLSSQGRNWGEVADASVARALEQAPDLAETHLSAGMVAMQRVEYRKALKALAQCLRLAPTCAEALHYVGVLESEAGRPKDGRRRLELALSLDPTSSLTRLTLAKIAALAGDAELFESYLGGVDEDVSQSLPLMLARVRNCMWTGRLDKLPSVAPESPADQPGGWAVLIAMVDYLRGDAPASSMHQLEAFALLAGNARLAVASSQFAAEGHATTKNFSEAIASLQRAYARGLIDIDWLSNCPSFDELRDDERFVEVDKNVKQRAAKLWRSRHS